MRRDPSRSYSADCVEQKLCELRVDEVLRSSYTAGTSWLIGAARCCLPSVRTLCPGIARHRPVTCPELPERRISPKFRTVYVSLSLADGVWSLPEDAAPPRSAGVFEFIFQPVGTSTLANELLAERGLCNLCYLQAAL